eukprot:TRINITY_DN22760_c0_g1_i1.p2 TRINITY_DN22760_c0_g1~~TRINITY_DN22760_c0_g1_i1.p2  ORF type:complete len:161 (+),score=53.72 TRINITY_DN22760_c0_g1_i1:59-484(+)
MGLCTFDTACKWLFGLSGVANIACGAIAAIIFLTDPSVVESLMCWYLCIFGCLQLAAQKKDERDRLTWAFLRDKFAFLGSDLGLGLYLVFVGTLGISFASGLSDGIKYILPFMAGCATCGMAVLSFVRMCCCSSRGYNEIA